MGIKISSEIVYNPRCRHCGKPMLFKSEGKTCYLFVCENKDCPAWHNGVEVPKTKLARKLAKRHSHQNIKGAR